MRKLLRWWIIAPLLAVCCVAIWSVVIHTLAPKLRRMAEERAELYFQTHFHSNVAISGFHVGSVFPRLQVTIRGVALRQSGRPDEPPLVEMRRVTFDARTLSCFSHHPVIKAVGLDGLEIRIMSRPKGSPPLISESDKNFAKNYPVVVQSVHVNHAELIIIPRDPGKDPHKFELHRLVLGPLGAGSPAKFEADLTNPVPRGQIHSIGAFGPWDADEPGATPVSGHYVFQNADMGTIKGLRGILSSTGEFEGPLNYLNVDGETEIPDFSLRTTHHPVDLHTTFSAIVDGTNGNTILKDVLARFEHSTLDVKGEVVDKTPKHGRTIVLDARTQGATVQDLLRLAVDSSPPVMTGAARLHANINIGEGNADLVDRMRLSGQFAIAGARFSRPATEQKIETLSLKGQGKPDAPAIGDAVSSFSGNLTVAKGLVTLSELKFRVTGAAVALDGTYNLDSGELDMRGKLRMQAKLSQTTTGVKSFFLKAIDPFFAGKDAGTVLPIKITGTKDHPSFGLDFHDSANRE
jgi:AsmA-like C-terminal region